MDQRDEDIMLDYQSGNDEAIEMIFTRYQDKILNFSMRILGNRADAEDVTGDVFLTLFSKQYAYNHAAKFSTWLYTVARNSCISRIRKRKTLVSVWFTSKESNRAEQWDIPDTNDLSHDQLEKKETAAYVRQAISRLPLEQKEAIILREYHNLSYEEISKVLNCTLEKVKALIFRARENLRGELIAFIKEGE